jgi:hypothetical protein
LELKPARIPFQLGQRILILLRPADSAIISANPANPANPDCPDNSLCRGLLQLSPLQRLSSS